MSQYIVSARKYRPDSFESLIGQDNIVQTLQNSIKRNQLAHAYLFCGPRGVGKTSAARIFAKTINCANPSENMEPCGECESCISFKEGRSYCIHEMDAASNNSVDDIKNLIEQVNIPPQIGKYSVYIVDEVHMLSTAAFNAFLKTLEEPPAHAIFILATTEKHKIPSTILSRCQTFDFNRISVNDAVRNLRHIAEQEHIKIDDEALHVIAMKSDGAMRDALTIFDQTVAFCGTDIRYEEVIKNLNVLDYDYTFHLVENFLTGDYGTALLTFNEILSKGFNALYFISALSSHFRDLMVCRSGGADTLLELPKSLKDRYMEQANRCPLGFLYEALNVTTLCESGYKASVNPRLHIEFALMKLCFMLHKPGMQPAAPVAAPAVAPAPAAAPVHTVASAPVAAPVVAPGPVAAPASVEAEEKPVRRKRFVSSAAAPVAESAPVAAPEVTPVAAPEVAPVAAPEVTPETVATPAPAPEVAPVQESTPVPEKAPARRGRRKAAVVTPTLSIDNMKQEVALSETVEVDPQVVEGDRIPTEDEIRAKWQEMAKEFKDKRPRLAIAISEAELRFAEVDGIMKVTFVVSNEAQKKWIVEKLLRNLEAELQQKLASSKVGLLIDVAAVEEAGKKQFTQKEKAQALASANPEVFNFIKDMDLDV